MPDVRKFLRPADRAMSIIIMIAEALGRTLAAPAGDFRVGQRISKTIQRRLDRADIDTVEVQSLTKDDVRITSLHLTGTTYHFTAWLVMEDPGDRKQDEKLGTFELSMFDPRAPEMWRVVAEACEQEWIAAVEFYWDHQDQTTEPVFTTTPIVTPCDETPAQRAAAAYAARLERLEAEERAAFGDGELAGFGAGRRVE